MIKGFQIDEVAGATFEWWHEVNAACDAYFKRKNIKWANISFPQMIAWDLKVNRQKKLRRAAAQPTDQ